MPAVAQVAPDAGRVLHSQEAPDVGSAPSPVPEIDVEQPAPKPTPAAPSSLRFHVGRFRVSGNSVFAESDLLPLIADFAQREVTLSDLRQAAARISDFYRGKGYLVARAYIPVQNIEGGTVEVAVLEGRVAAVTMRLEQDGRMPARTVQRIAAENLHEGSLVRDRDLERALLLMRDLPGVEARSTLRAGKAPGTSDIIVEASGGPPVTGSVDFDTYGEKFTGIERLGGTLNINGPLRVGDQVSLRAIHATGSEYARARYQLPIGASGLMAGLGYSAVNYHLCCDFAPLNAKGDAKVKSAYSRYPLVRSVAFNLSAALTYERKDFFNRTIAGTVSDYKSSVTTASLTGNRRDTFAGGGLTLFSLALGTGDLDLDLPANRAADAAGPKTQGNFSKLSFDLSRTQTMHGPVILFASATGQFASKNLDAYEQMVLGGAYGVRAYPQGEAPGDEGLIVNAELRWQIAHGVQLTGFYDQGIIRQHKRPWVGWQGGSPRLPNQYSIAGAGLGVNWIRPRQYAIKASVATPLGSNPGRDASGNDSDAARRNSRLWVQLAKYL